MRGKKWFNVLNCGMHISPAYEFYAAGDHAFTFEAGRQINAATNHFIIRLFQQIQEEKYPFIRDIIPAYNSITIVYDPLLFTGYYSNAASIIQQCFTKAIQQTDDTSEDKPNNIIRIPVCYHPSLAPDLESLCNQHQINIDTLITLHTQKIYRVYMNGFLPGFAYMGTVDDRIATARHSSPRKKVASGSVGIAGHQTGIYPFESPGGWQLIGRTSVPLFNPQSDNPCLLKPGDEVQFYPVPIENFSV